MTGHVPLLVVMGVSGSGKSSVGRLLAGELGVHFIDGDDLHPVANVNKMATGEALTDLDRWPWLADVGSTLRDYESTGLVIACSALRRRYRAAILWEAPTTRFIHLHVDEDVVASRLRERNGHFMPPALLPSQYGALEPLEHDEPGFSINADGPVDSITDRLVKLTFVVGTSGRTPATAVSGSNPDRLVPVGPRSSSS
jgi:gluconokinase